MFPTGPLRECGGNMQDRHVFDPTSFSPATYRPFATIGGYLYKKLLGLFWHKLNILRKKGKFNFKVIVIG
jgi:hypothetical protein